MVVIAKEIFFPFQKDIWSVDFGMFAKTAPALFCVCLSAYNSSKTRERVFFKFNIGDIVLKFVETLKFLIEMGLKKQTREDLTCVSVCISCVSP
jgi:hypothetical protein